ncbi:Ig-like domain-containing protein [Nocardia sp. XZ_19_369]|uniref:Ig-like domain-containing protein n=1 Tax=Nocardia sp. XZ_19_369 TaxID=2769487 RepID=UPI0018909AC1|nr:Ig-like domain-containing protein [Nocardia sp. XZ_19_369]
MNTKTVLVHMACWAAVVGGMAAACTTLPDEDAKLSVFEIWASSPNPHSQPPHVGCGCALVASVRYSAQADPSDEVNFYVGEQLVGTSGPNLVVEKGYANVGVPWTPATAGPHTIVVKFRSQSKSETVTVLAQTDRRTQ